MVKAILAIALLGSLPAYDPRPGERIPYATIDPAPGQWIRTMDPNVKLIPGYPPRRLFRGIYNGQWTYVWGWLDTENKINWFASENPHIRVVPAPAPAVKNYGVELGRSPSVGRLMQTNDPAFGQAFFGTKTAIAPQHTPHPEDAPCPGPGPCPNPGPNRPKPAPTPTPTPRPSNPSVDAQKYAPLGIGALAVGIVLFAHRRKQARS